MAYTIKARCRSFFLSISHIGSRYNKPAPYYSAIFAFIAFGVNGPNSNIPFFGFLAKKMFWSCGDFILSFITLNLIPPSHDAK